MEIELKMRCDVDGGPVQIAVVKVQIDELAANWWIMDIHLLELGQKVGLSALRCDATSPFPYTATCSSLTDHLPGC
jgi:hypothetical protein